MTQEVTNLFAYKFRFSLYIPTIIFIGIFLHVGKEKKYYPLIFFATLVLSIIIVLFMTLAKKMRYGGRNKGGYCLLITYMQQSYVQLLVQ